MSGPAPTFNGLTLSSLTGILEGKGATTAVGVVTTSTSLRIMRRNATNDGYEFADVDLGDLTGDVDFGVLAEGDIIYRDQAGNWANLARAPADGAILIQSLDVPAWLEKGLEGYVMVAGATLPQWVEFNLKNLADVADAVTDSAAEGDIIYFDGMTYTRL